MWLDYLFRESIGFLRWPITPDGFTVILVLGLLSYCLIFISHVIMRRLVRTWDRAQYRQLTGDDPSSGGW